MKHLLTAATLLLASTAALASDATFERTLSASAQPDLYVATGSGNIQVHPSEGSSVRIIGHIHAGWGAFGDIDARMARIVKDPPIRQDGNSIHVGEATDRDLYNNLSIDYDVYTPAATALNLRSGSGNVKVVQVGRYLSASSGSGEIEVHGERGPAEFSTGSGDITADLEGGGDVKARSGSGNIKIHGLTGSLTARTGSGNIDADGRLTGPAVLGSGSGNVHLRINPDAHFNLEASTGSGDIRIGFPGAPRQDDHSRHHLTAPINGGGAPLEVRTGSGDITIDGGGHASLDPNTLTVPATQDLTNAN
jgi:hypothetical protein